MFRSFIYLDEDKLYTYKRQIEGKNNPQPKAVSQKKTAGFSAGMSGFGLNGATETSIDSEYAKDVSFDYDRFELDLSNLDGEDYFDCVLNDDYDPTTIPSMKLMRLCSGFEVPEGFDLINIADKFMPLLMGQVATKTESEQEILTAVLSRASADIPIVIDCGDFKIAAKLNAKFLQEEYSALEEYEEQEVYLLCKVVGMMRKNQVEIFDPMKDFIHLPRQARRNVDTTKANTTGIQKIVIDGPILKVEVIAIYK